MHYCGIIIKGKDVTIKEARTLLGDVLVNRGIADWYSTDEYRERTFDGAQEISLKDFSKIFKEKWLVKDSKDVFNNHDWAFGVIKEGYFDTLLLPTEFYEYFVYGHELTDEQKEIKAGRELMIKTQERLYELTTVKAIDVLLESDVEYTVCLVDYHN